MDDGGEGSIPTIKGEFSAYHDRTTNRAPIRTSDHRREVANQVQRIAAPTRTGYSNIQTSVTLPCKGPSPGIVYVTCTPGSPGAKAPAPAGPIKTISGLVGSKIMTATTTTDKTPTPRSRAESRAYQPAQSTVPPTQYQPGHRPGEEGSSEEKKKGHQLDLVDRCLREHHHPLFSVDGPVTVLTGRRESRSQRRTGGRNEPAVHLDPVPTTGSTSV